MILWSAVLHHLTMLTVPHAPAAIERGLQIRCSALLKYFLSTVLCRETLECKVPLSFLSMTRFSSSPCKPSSDAHLLTIADDEVKCSEHDQVKEMPVVSPFEIQDNRRADTTGLMRNYHLGNIDVVASMPNLVNGKEHSNDVRIADDDDVEGSNARLSQSDNPLTVFGSKQEGHSLELCFTVHKYDTSSGKSSIRENEKSGKKIFFYESPGFWQEEDGDYHHKQKQKVGWQGERFHLLKSRGQHLLTNPRVLDSIIRKANVLPTDTVLEIGPGTGNLTIRLLECARKVIAVEIDERMVDTLRNRVVELGFEDKLVVIVGNVLKMELPHFDICVSNIPYGISSPLIAKFFLRSYKTCFRSATLLIQKEFAQRLLAKPGESDFNRLAVNVRLVASTDFLMNVSKKDFVPCPKVDSSLVQIQPKLNIPDINLDEWLGFTRTCFSKRNKTLYAIFKQKKKIIDLYLNIQSTSLNCKTPVFEDQIRDSDLDGNNEPYDGDGDIGTSRLSSIEFWGQNSIEVIRFREKILRILKDGGFGEKRPSKLSNEEFLCLLKLFNKEGVFFH